MEGGEVFFIAVGQIAGEPVVLGFVTYRVDDERDGTSVYDAFLDDMAPETFSPQLRKDFGARGFAQVRTALVAEDPRPGPTERGAPGYTIVDLSIGVRIVRGVDLRVLVRNLLNDDYLASQDVRAVAAPGRSASLSMIVRLPVR